MGEVYRGRDTRLNRSVALKVVSPQLASQEHFRERFDREALTISQLNHPNVCTLFDVGHHDGLDFLVMEFVEGETLADRLMRGSLTPVDALDVSLQIAHGLAHAHAHGIVHRDVKPANVMLTASGVVKILDFGVAKWDRPDTVTQVGLAVGHPGLHGAGAAAGRRHGDALDRRLGTRRGDLRDAHRGAAIPRPRCGVAVPEHPPRSAAAARSRPAGAGGLEAHPEAGGRQGPGRALSDRRGTGRRSHRLPGAAVGDAAVPAPAAAPRESQLDGARRPRHADRGRLRRTAGPRLAAQRLGARRRAARGPAVARPGSLRGQLCSGPAG